MIIYEFINYVNKRNNLLCFYIFNNSSHIYIWKDKTILLMRKINKKLQKIKVTKQDFKDFSKIVSIPKNLKKSMVLYITTWQEMPDDSQQTDTMTTKPEWFKEFEEKQEKRWKEQRKFNEKQEKFNEKILGLVESIINRIDNLVIKNNLKE